jgi:Tfp pilus assembly protein PilF
MGRSSLRLILASIVIASSTRLPGHAAERRTSLKEEMRFGVEAAEHGLWREAIFRWEKFLKDHPESARLRNNLAVAYESLGQFDKAEEQYRKAGELEPNNKEIKDNFESFQELYKAVRQRQAPPAPSPADAATPPAPAATPGVVAPAGAPGDAAPPAGGR